MSSQSDLFTRISERIPKDGIKHPPFTLILGSGFSYGIIPTTEQIVNRDLPWWKWCRSGEAGGPTIDDYHNRKEDDPRFKDKISDFAKAFWKKVHSSQKADAEEKFALDPHTQLPDEKALGIAYRFVLSSDCTPGLHARKDVRQYFGDMIRRAGYRTNAAHLFLAAILSDKRFRRLFGTIFTTNFDPLLQRSLQLFNVPYYVSDRPDTLQNPDDDDINDTLHIVQAHGSIYRYLLLNTPKEIKKYARSNRSKLTEYFRKHGVILVGFSGWDDAITGALLHVDNLDYGLYWCDRAGSLKESKLSPLARKVFDKHSDACYVPIKDADSFFAQLHLHLTGSALPRLFQEPIPIAKERLDICDLKGLPPLDLPETMSNIDPNNLSPTSSGAIDLNKSLDEIRDRLDRAQECFEGNPVANPKARAKANLLDRFSKANNLYLSDKFLDAFEDMNYVVEKEDLLEPADRALARFRRGYIYIKRGRAGDLDLAIADYTAIIEMGDNAPNELRAKALNNRGIIYRIRRQKGDLDRAIADYTAIIEMGDNVPNEQRAIALINRGFAYGKRGKEGDLDREIAEYTAVLEMGDDAPKEQRAKALRYRGITYEQRNQDGDVDRAKADYQAIIDMGDRAPTDDYEFAEKKLRDDAKANKPEK